MYANKSQDLISVKGFSYYLNVECDDLYQKTVQIILACLLLA